MKTLRLFAILILLALFAMPAGAQTTTVTATVLDPTGIPYAGGSVKVTLSPPGVTSPTVQITSAAQCASGGFGAAPCQVPFVPSGGPISLDPTGSFTMNVYDNTKISPGGTQWTFTINSPGLPPPLGTGPQQAIVTLTISGATQSISAQVNAATPKLSSINVNVPTNFLLKGTGAANYTCSATCGTYIAVDSTNLQKAILIPAGQKLTIFASGMYAGSAGSFADVAIFDGATNLIAVNTASTTFTQYNLTWQIAGDGLTHTITLEFQTTNVANAALISNAAGGFIPSIVLRLEQSQ